MSYKKKKKLISVYWIDINFIKNIKTLWWQWWKYNIPETSLKLKLVIKVDNQAILQNISWSHIQLPSQNILITWKVTIIH